MKLSLILAFLVLIVASCQEPEPSIKPILEPMTQSVYASVTVQPDEVYDAYATVSGILQNVPIEEGDLVKKGQLLAKIAADNPMLNLQDANTNLDLARENLQGQTALLENIRAERAAARLQLEVDSINYFRQLNLWKQNIGSKADLDSRKLRYELVQNQIANLDKRIAQTKRDLEANYERSKNRVQSARTQIQDFSIYAKMDGRVYALFKEEGELIAPQQPLAQIGHADSFVVELMIDEVDIAKVEVEQQVIIALDAYPKQTFVARIARIFPKKDERTQTFRAEATFVESPPKLFPGLTGEGNIIIQQKGSVLTIPAAYLQEGNTVRTPNGEQAVVVGLRGLDKVEIKSGIDTSTVILKPE